MKRKRRRKANKSYVTGSAGSGHWIRGSAFRIRIRIRPDPRGIRQHHVSFAEGDGSAKEETDLDPADPTRTDPKGIFMGFRFFLQFYFFITGSCIKA
jgi:hypothetical protein